MDDLTCIKLKFFSSEETLWIAASTCSFLMALLTPYQTAATLGIPQTKLICSIKINPTPKRTSSGCGAYGYRCFKQNETLSAIVYFAWREYCPIFQLKNYFSYCT
jgi:hypothetical protein